MGRVVGIALGDGGEVSFCDDRQNEASADKIYAKFTGKTVSQVIPVRGTAGLDGASCCGAMRATYAR